MPMPSGSKHAATFGEGFGQLALVKRNVVSSSCSTRAIGQQRFLRPSGRLGSCNKSGWTSVKHSSKPHIKKIRQVGVGNGVVIRRVGDQTHLRNHLASGCAVADARSGRALCHRFSRKSFDGTAQSQSIAPNQPPEPSEWRHSPQSPKPSELLGDRKCGATYCAPVVPTAK